MISCFFKPFLPNGAPSRGIRVRRQPAAYLVATRWNLICTSSATTDVSFHSPVPTLNAERLIGSTPSKVCVAPLRDRDGHRDVLGLALDRQLAGHVVLAARRRDRRRHERGLRIRLRVEPVLPATGQVHLVAEVIARDVDRHLGAARLSPGRTSPARKTLNAPSVGTFICFDTADTLLARSTSASAAPTRQRRGERGQHGAEKDTFMGSFIWQRKHPRQQAVAVQQLVLERRDHVQRNERKQNVIQ